MKSQIQEKYTKEKIKMSVGFKVIHSNQKIVVVLKKRGNGETIQLWKERNRNH